MPKEGPKKRFAAKRFFIAKKNAIKRGIFFDLELEWFYNWWKKRPYKCYYCGITAKQYLLLIRRIRYCSIGNPKIDAYRRLIEIRSHKGYVVITDRPTIDRVDSFQGYVVSNIVKCCWICNSLKGQFIHGDKWKKIAYDVMKEIWEDIKLEHKLQKEAERYINNY